MKATSKLLMGFIVEKSSTPREFCSLVHDITPLHGAWVPCHSSSFRRRWMPMAEFTSRLHCSSRDANTRRGLTLRSCALPCGVGVSGPLQPFCFYSQGWTGHLEKYSLGCRGGLGSVVRASSKATLWVKAQHEGALPSPCIVRKDPRVPHTARRGA